MDQLPVVTLVVVVLFFLGSVDSSAYDKIVTHSRIRARKEGPNVCALQQVEGTKKKYFSTFLPTLEILYECCPGYMKLDGMKGCPAVAPIDNVYNTLGLVKAATTQRYSDISKLRQEIEGTGTFTVFAPSNEAWDELNPVTALEDNVNIELFNALHYHMVNHRLMTKDMKNGMTVTSMYNDQGILINHYPNGVVTVNCARIIHGNQMATNGVVHVIDRVISSVTGTIKDYLESEEQLSSFNNAAFIAGIMDKLDQPDQFTLFAPTNEAFDKLTPGFMESIFENEPVIKALVTYHMLNSVQCAEAIMAGSVYETEEGSTIEIGCDGDSLTVNGIKMVLKKDIVASNGVIHLIDEVLIPDSAKEVRKLVGKSQSIFSDLVSEMGLTSSLTSDTQYTLLAPLNAVFTGQFTFHVINILHTEKKYLKLILENHMLKLKISLSTMFNGQLLETLSGKLLRVFIYRTAVCIESACMVRGSKEGMNGALHVMTSLIKPADKTTFELLDADGNFKIFLSLMETAGLGDLLRQNGSYTVFAPVDKAFEALGADDLDLLKSNVNALRNILLYHFSEGIIISGGLEAKVTNLLKSLQGKPLQLKSENNSIRVNSVEIPQSDLMATNGVVHVVKNVLYPTDLPVGHQDLLLVLQKLIKYIEIKVLVIKPSGSKVEVDHATKTVTRVIGRQPNKVTRVIGGKLRKNLRETIITTVNEPQIIEVPDFSKITSFGDNPALLKEESGKITRIIQEGGGFSAARKPPSKSLDRNIKP
uniref:Periostin, osteoblast specific factor a n=1 Tax=Xiphophorus couchianus TaxID=32473 RepID=A0A3B5M285_9TELE